ncbi:MAG: glycosyltransferase family 2 protein [bacterium]
MARSEGQKLPGVSFFCPAYLDEGNIESVVRKALEVLREHAERFEITIVEDGSPDNTAAVADRLAAQHENVRVIHHGQNRGYGEATKTGLKSTSFDVIAFTDGDGQYDPRDLARMFPHLKDNDAVIGYRLNLPNSALRNLLSRAYNFAMRLMFGTQFRDLSCATKVFKRPAIEALNIRSSGIFTQGEIVLRAGRRGFRIAQVGVPAYPRLHGKSSSITWKNFLQLVREAIALRREFRGG